MKILVFGAGVIGTLYGYALAGAGNDVTQSACGITNSTPSCRFSRTRSGTPTIGGVGIYKREQADAMQEAGAMAVQLDAVLWRGGF